MYFLDYNISAIKCLKEEKFNKYSMSPDIIFSNGELHYINYTDLYDDIECLVSSNIIGYYLWLIMFYHDMQNLWFISKF